MSTEIPKFISIPDALTAAFDEVVAALGPEFDMRSSLLNEAGTSVVLQCSRARIAVFKSRIGHIGLREAPVINPGAQATIMHFVVFVAHDIMTVPGPSGGEPKQQNLEQVYRALYISGIDTLAVSAVMHRLMTQEGWS